MKIAIGSDHAGYTLKREIILFLQGDHKIIDVGTDSTDSVDYPDYAKLVVGTILRKEADRAILICGTGIGMSIAANRYHGIRAAVCDCGEDAALLARKHNDANVLCLGARLIDLKTAKSCVIAFLTTSFEGGRHQQRLDKIEALS